MVSINKYTKNGLNPSNCCFKFDFYLKVYQTVGQKCQLNVKKNNFFKYVLMKLIYEKCSIYTYLIIIGQFLKII